jgi:diaminopimelate epimerase
VKFTKMHGLGNDYVYVDCFSQRVDEPEKVAVAVSDRHFGIGSDGLILICPPSAGTAADVRMRMFNADGSEGEMCGNGVRCVAKYAYDYGLSTANPMKVETGRGILSLSLEIAHSKVRRVTVDMGEPILELAKIPVNAAKLHAGGDPHTHVIDVDGLQVAATFVSMGNPHAVIFVPDVTAIDLERVGPKVEHHPAFPRRINAHWVQVISRAELRMRTWERGSGITLACGTGACAVAVAAQLKGRAGRKVDIHLPGGPLAIEWAGMGSPVLMTGPATEVYSGEWRGD